MFTGNYPFTGLWPLFQIDPFGLLQEWWRERERERNRERESTCAYVCVTEVPALSYVMLCNALLSMEVLYLIWRLNPPQSGCSRHILICVCVCVST